MGVGVASLFGWGSLPCIGALVVGVVCLIIYARRQLTMQNPVIDLRVFATPGFRTGALCVMLNFGITLCAMYILPQFYQNSMLLAVSFTGIVMLPGGIINAIVSMLSGRIYDKIGARIPALLGFGISVVALVVLMFANESSALAYVIACHILLMIGVPLAMSPCQTHALAALPHNLSTDGSTMINTMQQVMGAIATALATFLVSSGSAALTSSNAQAAQNTAFAQGAHWGFVFSIVLAAAAFVLALSFKKRTSAAGVQKPSSAGATDASTKSTASNTSASAAATEPSEFTTAATTKVPNRLASLKESPCARWHKHGWHNQQKRHYPLHHWAV